MVVCCRAYKLCTVATSTHPWYVANTKKTEIYHQFQEGNFVVQKYLHIFSTMSIDQTHKQVNKHIKCDGGAVGLTEDQQALHRWMVIYWWIWIWFSMGQLIIMNKVYEAILVNYITRCVRWMLPWNDLLRIINYFFQSLVCKHCCRNGIPVITL